MSHELTHGALHQAILSFVIEKGRAPATDELASRLDASPDAIERGLLALQEYHGVVLHPGTSKIWVIHPFSLAPTNFWVEGTHGRGWWGNCAWCSLGVAALVDGTCVITTRLGADDELAYVTILHGELMDTDYVVHFPVPMRRAWDNVIYTCSTMLLFEDEAAVDAWCARHRIEKGDVQPIDLVWRFARVWYGNHLSPTWTKWTAEEAAGIFRDFGLTGPIWEIPASDERF